MRLPLEPRAITRLGAQGAGESRVDLVAVEAPLTLTSRGDAWLTTMRTPGHDRELIVGWLIHERLVTDPHRDISSLAPCGRPGDEGYGDSYELVPSPVLESRLQARDPDLVGRTQMTSCGVCGHQTLEALVAEVLQSKPRDDGSAWAPETLSFLFENCTRDQPVFLQTGSTHAAAVVNTRGEVLVTREDVGRHNAVDKVVGHLALQGKLPCAPDQALLVSSRASFEIVHKAVVAGFSAVFCLSAPTSLAIDLSERCGLLLAGFFRAGGFNVYSRHSRLEGDRR